MSSPLAAQPLKVTIANGTSKGDQGSRTPPLADPADISSPHELTAFVETLLEQLDSKFDEMSSQILERMMQMSQRVDALEASIQDIINGDAPSSSAPSIPPSPGSAASTPQPRRIRSGLQ
ncbi:heat shock factor binding protein 1-domain-containing protein [Multifurca ochricompacta]|uniref:Heat shock factor binding protein 1-domain-containing protein n=1 Tax=Multifurca ochricompacta TaxID=376703 RepID=A0AAD4QIU9_9AGAM|nr:heat shock factor binding protein 1-domain-containing protein [Multifurca ochricompacta]